MARRPGVPRGPEGRLLAASKGQPEQWVFRKIDSAAGEQQMRPQQMAVRCMLNVIKRGCAAIGEDPTQFAGHSLRSGLITKLFTLENKACPTVMALSRHRSLAGLGVYIKAGHKDGL